LETTRIAANSGFPRRILPGKRARLSFSRRSRAYPYGIYDLARNTGFVNVGTDHDTGAFAVASIRGWWRHEGKSLYSGARVLLITADGGGSNGSRLRLWKLECRSLLMKQAFLFPFVTSLPAQANGTKLNTGCSRSYPRIGAASRFGTMRRS